MNETFSSPPTDPISSNHLVQIASRSEEFILPCLLLIGTTCNTLTFVVMRRGRMRHSSSCFYMAVLAIADTFVLWIGCLNRWLELIDKQRPILACNICCKLGTFAFFFFADCSVWITVAMTFERYIAVSQPLRASQVCTIKRARYTLLFVFTIFFLINSHFLWTFHLSPTILHCIPLNDQSLFIRYFTWIDSFKYSFCPLTLLITLNILIIKSLLNARNANKYLQHELASADNPYNPHKTSYSISFSSTSTTNNSANTLIKRKPINYPSRSSYSYQQSTKALTYRRVNRRLTTMLLAVSFAFCICSMPIAIMQLIDALYSDIEKRSITMNIAVAIGKIIAEISQYLNHSSNFFLYAFTGRVFRHELRRLFTCDRFLFFKSSVTSSQRLKNRAKKLMLIHNPTQGVHEHFYSNGKRHTRILIAPKPAVNFSENSTYRQSLCSAYSSTEIPLTNQIRQNSLLMTEEQDEHFLTCHYRQTNGPRASSATQTTSIMLLDSPSATIKNHSSLVSFVENIKNQQLDHATPLLSSSLAHRNSRKTMKPYGLTDGTVNG